MEEAVLLLLVWTLLLVILFLLFLYTFSSPLLELWGALVTGTFGKQSQKLQVSIDQQLCIGYFFNQDQLIFEFCNILVYFSNKVQFEEWCVRFTSALIVTLKFKNTKFSARNTYLY